MSTLQILDAAGRRRSPATLPGFHAGRPPRNKGFRYPPDPPRVEEIIGVMRQAGELDHGLRLRALIVVLWRAGLRIGEAMALTEPDLDPGRGSVLVRQGKGGKRREVGMDDWGFQQLRPWLAQRVGMPTMHSYRDSIRDEAGGRVVPFAGIVYPGSLQIYSSGLAALPGHPRDPQRLRAPLRRILTEALTIP